MTCENVFWSLVLFVGVPLLVWYVTEPKKEEVNTVTDPINNPLVPTIKPLFKPKVVVPEAKTDVVDGELVVIAMTKEKDCTIPKGRKHATYPRTGEKLIGDSGYPHRYPDCQ